MSAEHVRVIETDWATGAERYMTGTFGRAEAEASVRWSQENVTGRYGYRIVPVEPYMTDNGKARERHDDGHGAFPMEECADPACQETTVRLLARQLDEDQERGRPA